MNKKTSTALRHGGYSLILTVLLLAVLIVLNLGIGLLPAQYTTFSGEAMNLYEISDTSRDVMKGLKTDVTVYIVANKDNTDNTYLWIKNYVERYADLSSHLKVKEIDPVLYPNFLSSYTEETLSAAQTHLVIKNEVTGRARVIPYSNLYFSLYSTEEMAYYYMLYGYYPENPTYFHVESSLLTGIDYVTMAKLPTLYYTSGHGEITLDSTILSLFDSESIAATELPLATVKEIPADADAVLIYCPTKDFTTSEIEALTAYAEAGGDVILLSLYNSELSDRTLKNLYGFAEAYGMSYGDALVHENNSNHYYTYPYYILPQVSNSSYASAVAENTRLMLAYCHPIELSETLPEGVTVTELLTTTTAGFTKDVIDENYTGKKEDGDPTGKFLLGAVAEKAAGGNTSRLFWISSPYLLQSGTLGYFSNLSFMMSILTDACDKGTSLSVGATELEVTALTVSNSAADLWGVILIGVLPCAVLLYGFVLWYRRSRS